MSTALTTYRPTFDCDVCIIDGPHAGQWHRIVGGAYFVAPFIWTDGRIREAVYRFVGHDLTAHRLYAKLERVEEVP